MEAPHVDQRCPLQAQYTRNDTFEQRFGLLWPEDEPTHTSPIFLFCGQESTLE